MIVRAPGKLLFAGAYAVLDGAPALVVGVDRYACADGSAEDEAPMAEVRAAVGRSPVVDVSALRDAAARKLGLGSSAAAAVAALGVREAEQGADLRDGAVRERVMRQAWAAHAQVQSGGSGVDVAASTYGGALRYVRAEVPTRVSLPTRLVWTVFWSGESARTSDLRARVGGLSAARRSFHFGALAEAARASLAACAADDAEAFVESARLSSEGLSALGAAADAPIVSSGAAELALAARDEGAAFMPSGAGGGDCAIFFGTSAPSASFVGRATRLSQSALAEIGLDLRGVHASP